MLFVIPQVHPPVPTIDLNGRSIANDQLSALIGLDAKPVLNDRTGLTSTLLRDHIILLSVQGHDCTAVPSKGENRVPASFSMYSQNSKQASGFLHGLESKKPMFILDTPVVMCEDNHMFRAHDSMIVKPTSLEMMSITELCNSDFG